MSKIVKSLRYKPENGALDITSSSIGSNGLVVPFSGGGTTDYNALINKPLISNGVNVWDANFCNFINFTTLQFSFANPNQNGIWFNQDSGAKMGLVYRDSVSLETQFDLYMCSRSIYGLSRLYSADSLSRVDFENSMIWLQNFDSSSNRTDIIMESGVIELKNMGTSSGTAYSNTVELTPSGFYFNDNAIATQVWVSSVIPTIVQHSIMLRGGSNGDIVGYTSLILNTTNGATISVLANWLYNHNFNSAAKIWTCYGGAANQDNDVIGIYASNTSSIMFVLDDLTTSCSVSALTYDNRVQLGGWSS